jgi:hypothetical protein
MADFVVRECASCLDDIPTSDAKRLDCTHSYCQPCFTTLIMTAAQTESLFPPKCCLSEIPLKTVLSALDNEQRDSYKQKAAEWAQPPEKRWYCPEPQCAKWIAPSKIHHSRMSSQKCPHCRTKICGMCRGLGHEENTNCPEDFGVNAMLDLAETEGWRRCYNCRSLVEKTSGCRHMTCTCKAQFCYTCGSKWRTCECTEVDQARREEQLRERRRGLEAEARREEEEIARAIAEVEAAEQREAEERRAAEQREEEERRREEEELRLLEVLRLAAEEERRREEEEAEQKRVETIRSSIEERNTLLVKMLNELMHVQQTALISSHEEAERSIRKSSEERVVWRRKDYDSKKHKLMTNIEKRSKLLAQKHETQKYAVTTRHEEEEDATFMQVQLHLRGKPNKEAREKAMLETLAKSHKDEMESLINSQTEEAATLRRVAEMEARGLEHGHWAQLEKERNKTAFKLAELGQTVTAERHWFEAVTERRYALLEELRKDLLRTMGESNLLQEWGALPFPEAPTLPSPEPATSVSRHEQDLVKPFAQIQVSGSLPTPPPSPGMAEKIPTQSIMKDQTSSGGPLSKPQRPTLSISTSTSESHTAGEGSSQSVWDARSYVLEQSGTASTPARFSMSLSSTQPRNARADKPGRWSFLGGGSKKEPIDDEISKAMLRRTVGDAL